MSTTIMMPNAIQGAIQTMCEDAIGQAITALSTKYGFDADEAQRELNLGKIQIKGTTTKASPGKKAADPDKPKAKRGPTGYLLYTKELRPEVKAEMEAELGEGEKLKPQDVVTALAARWKALGDEEKAEWNAKAKSPPASDDEATPSAPPPTPKKETKKEAKKEAKKGAKKEAGESSEAPKKRQSGYLLFGKEMRADIKAAMEAELEEGEKLKPQAVVTEIAAQWKALSDEEKAEWNEKAKTPPSSDADSD
tara:strand:+ start:487 stop:1239 length:753 start_codon:yes stop_codon:yes gene_type:complete